MSRGLGDVYKRQYVHEGGDITIKFKFTDEYERMLEYIQMNEELTLISKAI